MANQNLPEWMLDDSVQKIDKRKLEFLHECFSAMQGKDQKQLLPILTMKVKAARSSGLQFTAEEMNIAVNAIKKYGTEESNKQIDELLKKTNK